MNLNQLYYLQAIAQARGLTRAADALYVTQSNLSHSMAALEEELGIPLLYKNGRDTLLTPYGQEFLAYAERAIQEIEEGKRVAQSRCSPTRGQVRLGFISAVSATLIPWCVSHFYQNPDNQGITFTFDEKPTRRIAADFTHHALDIGFGTRFDDSSFEFCPVVPEELWMRTTSSSGTACNPSGYTARRSSFSEKGSFSKSAWVRTSVTSMPSNFFA